MRLAFTNITNLLIGTLLSVNIGYAQQTWSLDQCLDSALNNNTQVLIANNNILIHDLKSKEVKSNLIPKVMVNGEYKYFIELPYQLMPLTVFGGPEGQFKEAQFGVPHNINANLILQAPLYSSSLYGAIEKTELSSQIIELQAKKTSEQIYFEVSSLYRNAQLLNTQIAFLDTLLLNSDSLLQNVKQLVAEELTIEADAKKVELQISSLSINRSNLEMKLAQIYNGIKVLMGIDSETEFTVDPIISIFELPQYNSNASAEYKILGVQEQILEVEINTLKKSRYIPDVGLVATYGTQGYGYDQSPNEFLNFYPMGYAGLRVSFPLFNGTVTNKKIKQTELELENTQLKKQAVKDANELAIENAINELKNAFSLLQLSIDQLDLSWVIYNNEREKHLEGLTSLNEVLFAQNEVIRTEQQYLQSLSDCLAADLQLKKLTNNISNN